MIEPSLYTLWVCLKAACSLPDFNSAFVKGEQIFGKLNFQTSSGWDLPSSIFVCLLAIDMEWSCHKEVNSGTNENIDGGFSLTFFLFPLFTTGILDYRLSKNNVSVTIKYYFVRLWAFHCSSFHFSKIKHICFEKVEEVQKIFISSGKIINSNFQLLLWPSFWRLQSTFLLDTLAYVKLWSYHQSLVAKLKRMIND